MKTLLVIFGITGDLSTRKLLPALGHIINEEKALGLSILGVSRRELDVKHLIIETTSNQRLADSAESVTMDVASIDDYVKLKNYITAQAPDKVLIYLAVPPGAAAQIVDLLGEAGVNDSTVNLLFEKPFGFDLASAQDFISRTARYFHETQLYRIDHYMGKEVAADLLRLRRNADTEHHHWGAHSVSAVTIVASEAIGIEGRLQFYEQTGALRDFVQGHLMQLLSLVLATKPTIDEDLPAQRLRALEAVAGADPLMAVRGQYEGYAEEAENPGSNVETFVSIKLRSNDPHWQGVPIRLVTGKALSEKRSYVEVVYKDGRSDVFEEGIGPAESGRRLDAYERVLLEAIAGRKELFTSSEEVIRSWQILADIQRTWDMDDTPIAIYKPGAQLTTVLSD